MAAPTDRGGIQADRENLRDLRADVARRLFTREQARKSLEEALRTFGPGSTEAGAAQDALTAAETELSDERADAAQSSGQLQSKIAAWLKDTVTGQPLDPDADVQRLTRLIASVILLPVRLETRFDRPARALRVRIYPDEIYSDIHERALLPEEKDAGDTYWANVGSEGEELLSSWTPLAERFGVARAAYIVRATDPSSESTPPPFRATSPSRQAEAVLPDRWVVRAYRNGELRKTGIGAPIPEPLSLTPDPSDELQTFVEVADGFQVPANISWTVKYGDALAQGMAVDLTGLTDDDLNLGFDRVVVIGVKTSMDHDAGGAFLADTFDGHHFSRGLALVPQGTATNNIPGKPTPVSMKDPPPEVSFQTQRGANAGQLMSFGTSTFRNDWPDFRDLNDLLCVTPFQNVPGTEAAHPQRETNRSACMNLALWPATLGYFVEQMMNPWTFLSDPANNSNQATFPDATTQKIKDFMVDDVIARGPGPAFRVGAVPYGVLPSIALSRWVPRTGENTVAPDTMRRLLPYWQAAAAKLPAVTRASTDRNLDLMKVLSQKASSDSVFVRNSVGIQTATTLFDLAALEQGVLLDAIKRIHDPILTSLAHLDWILARILEVTFFGSAYRYKGALVTTTPVNGKLDPNANYIKRLADPLLKVSDIATQDAMPEAGPAGQPKPLLFLLLRAALLLQAVKIGRRLSPQSFANITRLELEFFIVVENPTTVIDVLSQAIDTPFFDIIKADPEYKFYAKALANLQDLPVADLERMFTESLDLCSHRLEAWITALATRRLRQNNGDRNDENYVGGYGWVEDVRPANRTTRPVAGFTAEVQSDNGGYIHAPSMRHARAAAILRSGRMAEKSDPTKYAIELPSERARRAHRLVEGMRNEQPLGALLGYEFERGLRARGVTGTESFILALRKLFPLVANKSGLDPGQPADQIAARNVVDGKLLREAAKPIGPGLPFGSQGLPPKDSDGEKAISAEVDRINDMVDGLADLSLAETVFQVAGGDVSTAGAVMSALSEGENPPEPEITLSPTVGPAVNHKAALIVHGVGPADPTGSWVVTTPRGRFERFLDEYAGRLLGDPDGVTVKVEYQQGGQPKTDPAFSLAKTGLGALDFVALSQAPAVDGQGSVLDRRLKAAFLAQSANAGASNIKITYNKPAPPARSLAQLLEVARAFATFIGGARELRPADLRRPEDPLDDSVMTFAYNDVVVTRLPTARAALDTALAALDGDPIAGLEAAADFVPEAFPDPDAAALELSAAVDGARAELTRRRDDANAAILPTTSSLTDQLAAAVTALRIIFGRSTIAILPPISISWGQELAQSLAALKPAAGAPADVRQGPERYLQQVMRVRDRLGTWRRVRLYAGALGRSAPPIAVAQLPFVAGEQWAGRSVPEQGRLSLMLLSGDKTPPAQPDTTKTWRGLILDEWTELVPGDKVQTGLAFHYDSQGAKAPHAILACVHSGQNAPSGQAAWSFTELEAIVNETIDLARIRPVDSDMISLGQLAPAVVLAANTQNKTVSTLFPASSLEIPPIIVG